MLNLYNADDFLNQKRYVHPTDKKRAGGRKASGLSVRHTFSNGQTLRFKVVDSVRGLKRDEYERIAVVFVTGQAWQFKGWTGGRGSATLKPAAVFADSLGIFVRYDNVGIPGIVKEWKIPVLTISKNKRHYDRSAVNDCWSKMEEFLVRKKPVQMAQWDALAAAEAEAEGGA